MLIKTEAAIPRCFALAIRVLDVADVVFPAAAWRMSGVGTKLWNFFCQLSLLD